MKKTCSAALRSPWMGGLALALLWLFALAAVADSTDTKPAAPIKIGLENFFGTSNLSISNRDGQRRYSDGMWVGSSTSFPSAVYSRWNVDVLAPMPVQPPAPATLPKSEGQQSTSAP